MPRYLDQPVAKAEYINRGAVLPYNLPPDDIVAGLNRVYGMLYTINLALTERGYGRLEDMLLGNSFAGIMSELLVKSIALSSSTVIANELVGGFPDLLPVELGQRAILKGEEGIEVKASKQSSGWQGHNAERSWYMICRYIVDTQTLPVEDRQPTEFVEVLVAFLEIEDWSFSGRNPGSRRTPTASIKASGTFKLRSNVVYLLPGYSILPRTPRKSSPPTQTSLF